MSNDNDIPPLIDWQEASAAHILWNVLSPMEPPTPEFGWLGGFDDKERQQLGRELKDLYRKATRDGSWDDFDAKMHEWSESGWAALSTVLRDAFESSTTLKDKMNALDAHRRTRVERRAAQLIAEEMSVVEIADTPKTEDIAAPHESDQDRAKARKECIAALARDAVANGTYDDF